MEVLGIGYKKQSGKDTLAKLIKDLAPKRKTVLIKSFSGELYKEVSLATGVPVATIEANKAIFRPILQWWGTEFRKGFGENQTYWIDKLFKYVDNLIMDVDLLIIPDVRFYSEIKAIKDRDGKLVEIIRDTVFTPNPDKHSSETELDDFVGWDYIVYNDEGLSNLTKKAKIIADWYFPKCIADPKEPSQTSHD